MARNLGYGKLKAMSDTINGFDVEVLQEFYVSCVPIFKFALITTADAERTFSTYKFVLSQKLQI
jgi:hypothetical protein